MCLLADLAQDGFHRRDQGRRAVHAPEDTVTHRDQINQILVIKTYKDKDVDPEDTVTHRDQINQIIKTYTDKDVDPEDTVTHRDQMNQR